MAHTTHEKGAENQPTTHIQPAEAAASQHVELKQAQRNSKTPKLAVPAVGQENGYNCGPTVLNALLNYYGFNKVSMGELEKMCKTTQKYGSFPEDMVAAAETLGFEVEARKDAVIEDLMKKKDEGSPVIVLCTFHYLPLPDSVEIPKGLWYAWQDTLRRVTSLDGKLQKMFKPFEDVHYMLLIDYDEKNLTFIDVSQGQEKSIPKAEFEKRWFGTMDKKRPDETHYEHWMMTISKKDNA